MGRIRGEERGGWDVEEADTSARRILTNTDENDASNIANGINNRAQNVRMTWG